MRKRKAIALVEVVIAILISAMVCMATFSIFTSATAGRKKSTKRELASLAIRMVSEQLKMYVTSDNSTFLPYRPNNSWRLCNHLGYCDTYTGWALQSGTHNITSFLNTEPFLSGLCNKNLSNCSFTYTVANFNCGFGTTETTACKQVSFYLNYPN
jgi:type II secretory pathway pseudopilin PulG